jgi:hypothetical protein
MADEAKSGKHWQNDELDAIVADYFDMLESDLSGRAYIKSQHNRALMARIGRSHRSIEFKHQNISAVLDELGMAWIPGYIPKPNYQNAIFDAIDRYLTLHPAILDRMPTARTLAVPPSTVFVDAPVLTTTEAPIPSQARSEVRSSRARLPEPYAGQGRGVFRCGS